MLDQSIINLYDEFTHKPLTRKVFLKRLAQLVGSSTGALSILPLLESNYRPFDTANNADLFTEYITYAGVNGEMKAYVARPKEEKPYPYVRRCEPCFSQRRFCRPLQ